MMKGCEIFKTGSRKIAMKNEMFYSYMVSFQNRSVMSRPIPAFRLRFRLLQSLDFGNIERSRGPVPGGSCPGAGAGAGAGAGSALRLGFNINRINIATTTSSNSSIIFRFVVRFWYPVATVNSLSAALTSVAMRSTL